MLSQQLSTKSAQALALEKFLLNRTPLRLPYRFSSLALLTQEQNRKSAVLLSSCAGYTLGTSNPLRGNGISVLKSVDIIGAWEFYLNLQKQSIVLVAMGTIISESLSFKRSNGFAMPDTMFRLILDFAKSLEVERVSYAHANPSFLKMFERFVGHGWILEGQLQEDSGYLHNIC